MYFHGLTLSNYPKHNSCYVGETNLIYITHTPPPLFCYKQCLIALKPKTHYVEIIVTSSRMTTHYDSMRITNNTYTTIMYENKRRSIQYKYYS